MIAVLPPAFNPIPDGKWIFSGFLGKIGRLSLPRGADTGGACGFYTKGGSIFLASLGFLSVDRKSDNV